jgi:hypothetical protein
MSLRPVSGGNIRGKVFISLSFCVLMIALAGNVVACSFPPGFPVTFPLTFEVVAEPIDLVALTSDQDLGGIWAGENTFSNQTGGNPRCTVENRGYATVDFTVSATCSTGWTLGTTLGNYGPDRVVVAGIFTAPALASENSPPNGRDLAASDFANDDVLTNLACQATTSALARDDSGPDPDDPINMKGFNVVPYYSQVRHLRFMIQAPTSDTTGIEQTVVIIIGALLI